jgi:hypothetical protein
MKKCSTSQTIKEIQIKMRLRSHLTVDGMAIIKSTTKNADEDEMGEEPLYTVSRIVNYCNPMQSSRGFLTKTKIRTTI